MKILINGEVLPSLEAIEEQGLTYKETEDGIVINFGDCDISSNSVLSAIPGLKATGCITSYPSLTNYLNNKDNSLSQIISGTFKGHNDFILCSGNFVPCKNKKYDYVCMGDIRMFSKIKMYTLTIGLVMSSETIEDAYGLLEFILNNTAKKENVKQR